MGRNAAAPGARWTPVCGGGREYWRPPERAHFALLERASRDEV
jgi:hypothetical protein